MQILDSKEFIYFLEILGNIYVENIEVTNPY